ncbi:dynein heavy chain and region D6 of dynein motor-domain-containing protein [Fimicolochytrium jonesii]|uniref:dynein heavy chain and region D6 of dynein motor-domain-containing protein n=1 Tax=Fimicolochytrium jonesii TaxID=1396493 RepID=UPI0022FE7407|nr:dynein heavy chain and region D6 of dynein motor-domain-containing protein [Fimicolochytrium jonesii]KAI8818687.1 dynein heavy chain and region D6 of dynein motor-domain-containing protein [Fimicolochytrium jonesii]
MLNAESILPDPPGQQGGLANSAARPSPMVPRSSDTSGTGLPNVIPAKRKSIPYVPGGPEEEHALQRASALKGRLYTVVKKGEVPRFDVKRVDPKRGGAAAAAAHRFGSGARLEPIEAHEIGRSDGAGARLGGKTTDASRLRARQAQVIPASSARSHSARRMLDRARQIVGMEEMTPAQANQAVELGKPALNVIPPIAGDVDREDDSKRLRVSGVADDGSDRELVSRQRSGTVAIEDETQKRHAKELFAYIKHLENHPQGKEFQYMNPIKTSVKRGQPTFNPYNLQLVEYADTDKTEGYYTISAAGVTHFDVHGHGDFTPLAQWKREYDLFHSLLRIPFFGHYRLWKCFSQWRKTVLQTKIAQIRRRLAKNLFVVHPILRTALLKIRACCVDIVLTKRLVKIEPDRSYELLDFVREQKDWIDQISGGTLKEWEDQIRKLVEDAGVACLKEKGFDVQIDQEEGEEEESMEVTEQAVPDVDAPVLAIVKKAEGEVAEPRKLTYTEQAARRTECRRLQRFVKLADYMIVTTLHLLTLESVRDLLRFVFKGCVDADVEVDGAGGGTITISDPAMLGESDGMLLLQEEADNKNKRTLERTASSNGVDMVGLGAGGVVQVGGAVVGENIGTGEIGEAGFEGFFNILSKIVRQSIPATELIEVIEETGPTNTGGDMMDIDLPERPSLGETAARSAQVADKTGKDAGKHSQTDSGAKYHPLFRNELLLQLATATRNLYFAPSLPDFLTAVDILFKSYLGIIDKVDLLTNTIEYLDPANVAGGAYSSVRGLEEGEYGEGPQITAIVSDGAYFRELCGRIRGVLVGVFANASEWMQTWEEVRNMWVENEGFDTLSSLEAAAGPVAILFATAGEATHAEEGGIANILLKRYAEREIPAETAPETQTESKPEVKTEGASETAEAGEGGAEAKEPTILELGSTILTKADGTTYSPVVEFFEHHLAKFALQRQKTAAIPITSTINNLMVDTTKLKSILVPSPERCFSEVASFLPGLSRDKNELLLNEVQVWVRTLNTQPANVEGFVEYLGWLEKVKGSMPLVEQLYDEVSRLYKLMEQYKISIQPTDLAMYQTLGPTLRQLKEVVDMASDTKDENISRFSVELDKSLNDLMAEVSEVRNRAQDPMVLNAGAKSDMVIKFLEELREQLSNVDATKARYEQWGLLFKSGGSLSAVPKGVAEGKQPAPGLPTKGGDLEETKAEVNMKRTLWMSLKDWDTITKRWREGAFESLNTEEMNADIQAYVKIVYNLDKGLPPNEVVPRLKAMVDEYRGLYATIVDLRNPALKARHWEKIQDALGKVLVRDETFTLEKLMELRVFDFKDEISNVSSQAGSEAALEEMLGKVVKTWNEVEFVVAAYRDAKDVFILGSVEDVQTLLEDSQVTIATIKSSRFIGPIRAEVERWDKQLSLFTETLDAWLTCQRNWLYLESIFSAPDIQRQLPDEARMFSQVDRSWKDTMRKVHRNPNAMKSGTTPGLLETMQQNNVLLDQIQKCLEDYLESKRLLFPRFYFLSNEELLEILSQTRNPQAVQPHLSKCFDAIKSLEFSSTDPKSIDINAMNSPEGEKVAFLKTIKARGNVEAWLGNVEEGMVAVLRRLVKQALAEFEDGKRSDWVREHVGQVVLTGNQILWTRDVSECLKTANAVKALQAFKDKCIKNLSGVAALVRGELTKIQRGILGALITMDVHNRDIVQGLIDAGVTGMGDFEWTKQQRYYWDVDNDTCLVKMSTSTFIYGYEYLGCSPRLVITPLTDRCYLTLTGAMQLNLGGSPLGPAGTGKTETVKDLAKALARQCVVYNCSDGMDYKMMGKMFAGLAQSGAWCCFDEFNRIDIEVLSVIAQQLLTIKNAKDMKATRFMFESREIRLIDTCTAFITMNPGYAGRQELPDNLKALFRPIAMMIPDYGLIAEIMLFSEGFENAKVLAGKVVNLYKLCSEQLSQQDHYDFGMRAVKSVLTMAGALKRNNPELSEEGVLIRALRDSNLPKFLAEDIGLFRGILSDLFPGIIIVEQDYGALVATIKEVIIERKMEVVDSFVTRICQLYETNKIRHGVMLVGPTGGGKTACYEILQEACNRLKERAVAEFQAIKTWVLNPKCISMTELYGEFNLATMEWKDGLIGYIFRQQVQDNSLDEKWTVCDGPVDALWIENMNTVLDDNKLLTLINGERIKMNNTMHMLFEVADLAVASPATVSRCGMVYMDPTNLGWRSYIRKWMAQLPANVSEDLKNMFWGFFDVYVDPGLRFIRKQCQEYIKSVDLNLVQSLSKLLLTFIVRKEVDLTRSIADVRALFSNLFVFCYVWALGGNLADGFHDTFDTFVRDLIDANPIPDVQLPSANNMFCYYVDLKTKSFALWDDLVPAFKYTQDVPFFQMTVPTSDTVKYEYFLEALLMNGFPTMFTGNTGVGKSIIVQSLLNRCCKTYGWVPVALNFSAQTNSAQTQQIMELKLEKKRKNIMGAPTGFNKIILFVDDLNMPKLDTYGSQPPIELLRQYLDFHGFYDREKLTWKAVEDIEIVAACAPPGGGRNNVTPRLLRHFNLFNIPAPSELTLGKIFRAIVEGFLRNGFVPEVKGVGDAIVNSSIEIYHRMCAELLPTPAKSHYTFNLRDLSRVVQGVLQARPQVVQNKLDIVKVFCHEASRVFHDRLIDESDRSYFNKLLSELVEKNFGVAIPKETLTQKPILFGDFGKRGVPPEDRLYVEMADMKVMNTLLEEYLEEYNVTNNKDVRLIFFMDAKQHITRINRIIRQPRGNALLVGVGGTGKQSLTRLACHISDYQCIQIELTRTYGQTEWREDIKRLYRLAGQDGKNTVFLLSDTQIKTETFLEDINNILNSGEVPNLFEFDEREKILGELRSVCREKGLPEDRDSVYQFFINRVRDNLHIVFATSPVGDTFRTRCRMFPSLVNCCTIDWFDEWPREALLSVSRRFLEFVDLGSNAMKEKIAEMCVDIHESVGLLAQKFWDELRRRYYTTPTSYLELINLYTAMLQEKRKELGSSRDRLRNGLNKLLETNELVANMQVELEQLGPELKQRAQDTEVLMVKIGKDQETADGVRKVVSEEETVVRAKANETEAIAAEAQRDLDEALPALNAAYKALDALDKKDIAELKVFTKPPDAVLMVMEAICTLFKTKADWDGSKKLLGDPQFMKKMAEFDKDNIEPAVSKKLKKYIENPNFNPDAVEKVSKACKSMCMWVIAMDLYSRVNREVAPKRKRLEEAAVALESTRAKLAEKAAALAEVENQLAKLKAQYEDSIASKRELVEKMEETTRRLARAGKLTTALADEQVRWAESVEKLNQQIEDLVGNIFLSAACVAYFGAFTSTFRAELVAGWIKRCQEIGIPVSENFNLFDNLADPAVVRDWNIQGLPADPLSTENGILVTRGRRWPLMIDPQGQANRWIKAMEGNELKIVKLSDPKFLRSLENAVRTGQPVLMEDVGEQLDPSLEPLLLKQTVRQGGRLLIKLGDSFVEYDRNFKLYITTKLANPHYLPEVCIKVTIINFTVTKVGLEGQLLADVVRLERPELEEQRNTLIVNIAADRKALKDIEERILKLLFNSQGNILDDEELINTLNQSKVTSAAIKERVAQAEVTEKEINIAREKYRPVAIRGSVLYFVIADLAGIDSMYQFSLKYFKNLFSTCIQHSEKANDLQKRIEILCKTTTYSTFANVSRGLFEQHKMAYSFMICVQILRESKAILDYEWNFLLRGGGGMLGSDLPSKPNVRWLSNGMWENLCDLARTIPEFGYAIEHLQMYTMEWEAIVESDNPYSMPIPGGAENQLTDFQRLLLIKVLREEKVVPACVEFVKKNLGQEFIDIPPLDLAVAYKDIDNRTPFIFILSTGSDPVSALMKFAASKELNMQDRLHMISLGQGQGPIAEQLLRRAMACGDWVFLQNCHLAASWMSRLETIVKEFSQPDAEIHENFRIFLSSMPSKVFPIAVLQDGVKVTNEPPKGLKANVARSFADISRDLFDEHPPQGPRFRKLLFGVCFFNAVIQERKKFGPLGWNILYDWSNSDLEVSITILKNMLQESKTIPWDALSYLTGEITFGGRVTDDWDRRTLRSILARFYTPQILDDSYKFSPSGIYHAPPDGDLASYRAYIDRLPFSEEPSVFGMHENADISYQIQETRRLLRSILEVQPRLVTAGGGKSSEEIVTGMATAILNDWPAPLILEIPIEGEKRPKSARFAGGAPPSESGGSTIDDSSPNPVLLELFKKDESGRMLNSLSTVLSQEAVRFNKLNNIVRNSLQNLVKAVKGLVVMSSELELVFKSLLNNEVPHAWSAHAYPSLKPLGAWVKDFHKRMAFIKDWADNGQPTAFWLPGFFFPQGFLTGVLQNHARKYNIPIDTLTFSYKVLDYDEGDPRAYGGGQPASGSDPSRVGTAASDTSRPITAAQSSQDGVLVHGLFMEGARWDREKRLLQDSFPMEMYSTMPLIRFIPVPTSQAQGGSGIFVCPLYKTSARAGTLSTTGHSTNFVVPLNIPSDRPADYWISKGVALLCQLNE